MKINRPGSEADEIVEEPESVSLEEPKRVSLEEPKRVSLEQFRNDKKANSESKEKIEAVSDSGATRLLEVLKIKRPPGFVRSEENLPTTPRIPPRIPPGIVTDDASESSTDVTTEMSTDRKTEKTTEQSTEDTSVSDTTSESSDVTTSSPRPRLIFTRPPVTITSTESGKKSSLFDLRQRLLNRARKPIIQSTTEGITRSSQRPQRPAFRPRGPRPRTTAIPNSKPLSDITTTDDETSTESQENAETAENAENTDK